MTTTPDLLAGPFPTGRELTDYSGDPDFAIRAADVPPVSPGTVARTLARLGYSTRDDEKAA